MYDRRWLVMIPLVLGLAAGCSSDDGDIPGGGNPPLVETVVTQLTDNTACETNPVYSPDGEWIVYESNVSGNGDIWRLRVSGGTAEQLTTDPAFDTYPYWTADGQGIVFESERSGNKAIWYLDLSASGATPVPVTAGDENDASPASSPTGPWVVFESTQDKVIGSDIWVINIDGTDRRRLTFGPEGSYARTATWSPDGLEIAYETNASGESAIHVVPVAGSDAWQLTPTFGYEGHPAWSPDGSWIAFESTRDGAMNIFIVPADGGDLRQVTTEGGYWPGWSPDGHFIVYGILAGDEANLWTAELGEDLFP